MLAAVKKKRLQEEARKSPIHNQLLITALPYGLLKKTVELITLTQNNI